MRAAHSIVFLAQVGEQGGALLGNPINPKYPCWRFVRDPLCQGSDIPTTGEGRCAGRAAGGRSPLKEPVAGATYTGSEERAVPAPWQGWCRALPGGNAGLTFARIPGTATAPSWRQAPSQSCQTPLSPGCPALPGPAVAVGALVALPAPCWLFLCRASAPCVTLWGCPGWGMWGHTVGCPHWEGSGGMLRRLFCSWGHFPLPSSFPWHWEQPHVSWLKLCTFKLANFPAKTRNTGVSQ